MLSQQIDQLEKKTPDQLDDLTGRLGIRKDQASSAAYGDETAVAQYNALPNVQLPPFFGNALEFAINGGRCSFIWWIKIQKSPRL